MTAVLHPPARSPRPARHARPVAQPRTAAVQDAARLAAADPRRDAARPGPRAATLSSRCRGRRSSPPTTTWSTRPRSCATSARVPRAVRELIADTTPLREPGWAGARGRPVRWRWRISRRCSPATPTGSRFSPRTAQRRSGRRAASKTCRRGTRCATASSSSNTRAIAPRSRAPPNSSCASRATSNRASAAPRSRLNRRPLALHARTRLPEPGMVRPAHRTRRPARRRWRESSGQGL